MGMVCVFSASLLHEAHQHQHIQQLDGSVDIVCRPEFILAQTTPWLDDVSLQSSSGRGATLELISCWGTASQAPEYIESIHECMGNSIYWGNKSVSRLKILGTWKLQRLWSLRLVIAVLKSPVFTLVSQGMGCKDGIFQLPVSHVWYWGVPLNLILSRRSFLLQSDWFIGKLSRPGDNIDTSDYWSEL